MSDVVIIGNVVEKNNAEKEIVWEIPDFFDVAENKKAIQSPQFSFADVSWYLRMVSKSVEKIGFMNLILMKVGHSSCSVEYNFGLKTLNSGVEHLRKAIFERIVKRDFERSESCFLKLSEIKEKKSVLSDVFTILCTLKRREGPSSDILKLTKLDTLSENFRSLLFNKDSCDTTLLVMGKEYKAHKTVLMARSTVFAAMFLHETSEKQTGFVTIQDCDSESFEKFLEFLYTGKLEELSPQDALHLYETSDKYDVRELKTFCVEYLMVNLTVENWCDIAITADKYEDSKLSSAAQDFFNENLKDIFNTSEWDNLVRNNYCLSKKLLREMSLKVKVVH